MNDLSFVRMNTFSQDILRQFSINGIDSILIELEVIEVEIKSQVQQICDEVLYKYIPQLPKNERRIVLSLKREIFNSFENIKNINSLSILERVLDEDHLLIINKHIGLRKRRIAKLNELCILIEDNQIEILEFVKKFWKENIEFRISLYLSSPDLYSYISEKGIDEQIVPSIYRYFIRGSLKATPSSFWSGINLTPHSKEFNFSSERISKKMSIQINHSSLRKIINKVCEEINLENSNITNMLNLNPTLFLDGEYYYFWSLGSDGSKSLNKLKVNHTLINIINSIKSNEIFLSNISTIERSNIFRKLIKNDVVRLAIEPYYEHPKPFDFLTTQINDLHKNNDSLSKIHNDLKEVNSKLKLVTENNNLELLYEINKIMYKHTSDKINVRVDIKTKYDEISIDEKLVFSAKQALSVYAKIIASVYNQNKIKGKIKTNFIEKFGANKKVPILTAAIHMKGILKNLNLSSIQKRSFYCPDDYKGKSVYNILMGYIKEEINKNKHEREIEIPLSFIDELPLPKLKLPKHIEVVYQWIKRNNKYLIIPEMISTQPGRLSGRFFSLLEEYEREEIESNILVNPEDYYQVNLHQNGPNDNLSFNLKNIEKKLTIYGPMSSASENINIVDLSIIYDNGVLKLVTDNDEEIAPWIATTLSPGNDFLARLLNELSKQHCVDLNGHIRSHLDLGFGFSPRIRIGELILSRARWKFLASNINNKLHVTDDISLIRSIYKFKNQNNLPRDCFVTTDVSDKPFLLNFESLVSVKLFLKVISKCNCITLEERLPSQSDLIKIGDEKTNMEVWSILCLH
jgi:hypothetical protein